MSGQQPLSFDCIWFVRTSRKCVLPSQCTVWRYACLPPSHGVDMTKLARISKAIANGFGLQPRTLQSNTATISRLRTTCAKAVCIFVSTHGGSSKYTRLLPHRKPQCRIAQGHRNGPTARQTRWPNTEGSVRRLCFHYVVREGSGFSGSFTDGQRMKQDSFWENTP